MSWQDATIIIAVTIHLSLLSLQQAFRHDQSARSLRSVTTLVVWSIPLLLPPFICLLLLAACGIVALSSKQPRLATLAPTIRQSLALIAAGLLVYSIVSLTGNQRMPDQLIAVGAFGASIAVFWKHFLRPAPPFSA